MSNAIRSSWKHAVFSLAAMAIICASPLARADPLGTTGYAAGSQSFVLSQGGSPGAGGFKGTWNSAAIIFWCIELDQYFGFGGSYNNYVASEPDNPTFTLLGQLFNEAYGLVTNPLLSAADATKYSAAFQLAIWEIVYEGTNTNPLSLLNGSFMVTDDKGHSETVALANSWLANLGNYTDTYHLILLHSDKNQDFVTFGTPFGYIVPEPAPLMLMAAALLAMIVVRRRRERRIGA